MDGIIDFFKSFDYDRVDLIVEMGGPVLGIVMPIIEAFIPILPLVFFVTVNIAVFGFFYGYFYSWLGTCIGSYLLFLIIRKIGGKKIKKRIERSKYKAALEKIHSSNFSLLFVLYCIPFTPSFLLSATSALVNMTTKNFLIALLPSKLIMLISLALIGVNISTFFEKPIKSGLFVVVIIFINFCIKKIMVKTDIFVVKSEKNK